MRISAIIPVWCEAGHVDEAVRCAASIADEVVVVDAHSPDGTAAAAAAAGARVVHAEKGRGAQLRAGAEAARGDALLFLHADARLPPTARVCIDGALSEPATCAGNFALRFVPDRGWARVFTWANHLRRRWLRIYYGDSAIFVRRRDYEAIGGFAPLPLMEDYDLVRRLERHGRTAYVTDVEVRVSARRFERAPLRTLFVWVLVQALYTFGVRPARLARLYADIR